MEPSAVRSGEGGGGRARRIRRHALVLLIVAALTLVLPVSGLLWRVSAVRGWAASRVVSELAAALDAEVAVGQLDIVPGWPPRLILTDLSIQRRGRVIARIGRLVAEPRLGPLAKGRLDLASLLVERARLDMDLAEAAEASARRPPSAAEAPRIDALIVRDSSLSLRGGPGGLELDVPDLEGSTPGFFRDGRLYVRLEGQGARVAAAGRAMQPVDFSLRLGRDDRGLRVDDAHVTAPGLSAWLRASVDLPASLRFAPPREPSLLGRLEIEGTTSPLIALGLLPDGAPDGVVAWEGDVRATPRGWAATGRLSSDELVLRQDLRPTAHVTDVSARVALSTAAIEVTDLRAGLAGGDLTGELRATRGAQGWLIAGAVRGEGLAIERLPLPRALDAARPPVEGTLGFDLDGVVPAWDPGDARGAWSFGLSPRGGTGQIPLGGEGRGRHRDRRTEIVELDLSIPGAGLALSGTVGPEGALDVAATLEAPRLRDALEALRPHVRALGRVPAGMSGALVATGAITGTLDAPAISASLQGAELAAGRWPLGALDGRIDWREGLDAELALDGPALALGLAEVRGGAGRPLTGRWDVHRADMELLASLAGLGQASGAVTGSGSFALGEDPSLAGAIEGEGLVVAGQAVDRLALEARATSEELDVARLELARGAGSARGRGRMPWRGTGGECVLDWTRWPLSLPLAGAPLTADLSGSARLAGSLAEPALPEPVTFSGQGARWRGLGPLELEGEADLLEDAVHLRVGEAGSGLSVDVLAGREAPRLLRVMGTLPRLALPLPTGEAARDVALELDQIDLAVDGSLADLEGLRVQASARAFALRGGLGGEGATAWRAEGAAPLRIAGTLGRLALDPVSVAIFGQDFTLGGSARLIEPVSWDVDAEGEVPLRALEPLMPGARLGGKALITLRASGEGATPAFKGEVLVDDGYLNHPALKQSVRAVDARAVLERDTVTLERLRAVVGGGQVSARGEVTLEGWQPVRHHLELSGQAVGLKLTDHLRVTADFELSADRRGDDTLLSGDVRLLRGRLTTPVTLGGRATRLAQLKPPSALDDIVLDLRVLAPDQFVIDNGVFKGEFEADLDIVGIASHPVALGSLDIVREGQLFYKKTIFDLSDASLQLTRAFPNDAEMEAHATARVGFHEVQLALAGRASEPVIELSSRPELPQESLAAMLATSGMISTGLADEQAAVLPAPFASGPMATESALSAAGVDPIRLDPVFVEGSALPSARLTVGRQLTPKLFAGYSMSLRGDQEGTVELRYRVKPRLELRMAYQEDGTNVGEARWTRSWNGARVRAARAAMVRQDDAPRVRVISIAGLGGAIDAESLRAALELATGEPATRGALLRAAGSARDFLVARDHPLARVECGPDSEVEDGQVDVLCRADLGPRVALAVQLAQGDAAAKDSASALRAARAAVLEAWGELAFRDELVPAATVAARDVFLARGHAQATARGLVEEEGDSLAVQVTIDPGEVVRVDGVSLHGVESLDARALSKELASTQRRGLKRPLLTPALAARDAATVLGAYQEQGFVDAQVPPPGVTYPTAGPLARLDLRVTEGERRRLVGVLFSGGTILSRDELEARLALGAGDIASPDRLDAFAREVSEALDAQGHPDAALSWRLRRVEDGVLLECVVAEGPAVEIGDVRVEGLAKTREALVRREVRLEPGDPFRRGDLAAARRRVSDLGLFQSVVVRGEPRADDPGVRDVLVRVIEKPEFDVSFGFGVDDSNPRGSFSIGMRNVAGIGASLGFQLHAAGEDRLIRVLAGLQRVGGTRNDLLLVGGFERDDRPGYTSEANFFGAQVSRSLGPHLTLLPRVRWEDISLPRLDVSASEARLSEGVVAGPGVALLWDTRDDPLWPRRGSVASLDLGFASEAFGSDHSFTKAFAQYSVARSLGRRGLILAGSIRAGAGWSFDESDELPLSERFYAGGVASVRGWKLDHLGPKDPVTGEPVGGDAVLVLNGEVRVPVTRRAWFVGFVDAGNVYASPSGLSSPSLELTFGPGVAISTPVGPLRFYYGHKFDDPRDEPSGEFHFTFGGSF